MLALRALAVAVALLAACTGTIEGAQEVAADPRSGADGEPAPPTAVPPAPSAPAVPGLPAPPRATPAPAGPCAPLRRRVARLTPAQYIATVRAVVPALPAALADELAGALPQRAATFDNDAGALVFAQPYFDRLYDLAAAIAGQAVRDPAALAPCLGQRPDDPACVRSAVESVGARLFRRPLAAEETASYLRLFESSRAGAGAMGALTLVLRGLLTSPNTLFRTELGAGALAGEAVPLTAHERAAALAFLLTDAPPDARLTELANRGELQTAAQVEAEARRLLSSATTGRGLVKLFVRQLDADSVVHKKNAKLFSGFTTDLLRDMAQETAAFTERVLWGEDGRLATLLTAEFSMLNARLAKAYGAQAPTTTSTTTWTRLALPAGQRSGVLTQASFLANHAGEEETDIVGRGKFVRERLLCQTLPPPPPDVPVLPKPDGTLRGRERIARHSMDPACATCHRQLDPVGFLFEAYDAFGRWRTTDAGKSIDARGAVVGLSGGDVALDGALELGRAMARVPETTACFARQMAGWALADEKAGGDACRVRRMTATLEASGGKILDALAAFVASDDFLFRAE